MTTGEYAGRWAEASFQLPVEKEMWKEEQQAGRWTPKLHAGTDACGPDDHVNKLLLLQSDTQTH